MHHEDRILAPREEQDRPLELGGDLTHHEDRLGLELTDVLWAVGDTPTEAILVDSASLSLEGGLSEVGLFFKTGAFVGEVDALRSGEALSTSARVVGKGRVFTIARADLCTFFADNPGVLISFLGTRFVE